jgi:alcohol dehydrogenase (cytochrome c)
MRNKILIILGVLVVMGAIAGGLVYANLDTAIKLASMAVNYVKYLNAPAGTTVTELAPGYKGGESVGAAPRAATPLPNANSDDWASYNKTLTSERFSQLSQINTANVNKLKVLCTYDTGQYTGFNSGLIEVNDALIFTTQFDIFSIDPATCRQNWRTHEDYKPATPQPVSRGAAYMDGLLFRGSGDGRVLAYDFKTGKRVWATTIADAKRGGLRAVLGTASCSSVMPVQIKGGKAGAAQAKQKSSGNFTFAQNRARSLVGQ